MQRITTIDVTRGLVMVIMALDHVRDLLHLPALTQNPTDLSTTTAPIFLTRWITHLCAPTFVFLSGTSAYLSLRRRYSADPSAGRKDARRGVARRGVARLFLLKRGLVLIALEVTLINFAFWTDVQFRTLMLQVIFVIGGGLVLLSFLANVSVRKLAIVGLVIISLHDLLLLIPAFPSQTARLGWSLLFRTDLFRFDSGFTLLVAYALIPWFGIMLVGYACGSVFERPMPERRKRLVQLGTGASVFFVLLRFINSYGDAAPWSVQATGPPERFLFTFLSFLNVSKYPPSLLYTALMLGMMFLILAVADGVDNGLTRVLTVYGKVPLFYYLVHWYLVKLAMILMVLLQGYSPADLPIGPLSFGRPPEAGVSLPVVYVAWLALVALLYPICRWYGRYKAAHPETRWLRYV